MLHFRLHYSRLCHHAILLVNNIWTYMMPVLQLRKL